MAKETILATLKYETLNLTDHEVDLLIQDLYELIISIGGDFTKQNIRYYLLEYIKNDFYPRFRAIHKNEL